MQSTPKKVYKLFINSPNPNELFSLGFVATQIKYNINAYNFPPVGKFFAFERSWNSEKFLRELQKEYKLDTPHIYSVWECETTGEIYPYADKRVPAFESTIESFWENWQHGDLENKIYCITPPRTVLIDNFKPIQKLW
ncbi:MAG: hypothetical protein IPM51_11780 [Sphingobacteriaceae bacterium]|nr:hypothetical protein [Sphingobacteriaceae bacterium]